ncbi:MAG: type I DNA topoisomerase, partial [Planctomycetota bacterium]|nr:type I DNA topoisomerase [Planctomycetota bacterium]
MTKYLVIVESPTKAKTLKKYLGKDFLVESSIGHIRDLPARASEVPASHKGLKWANLGVNVDEEFAPLYVVHPDKKKKITELKAMLKQVEVLLLATDEDREGEAISWHLVEVLKPKVPTKRMVFHEITKPAILAAVQETREIDEHLVNAQETRRIIDRLFGYEVSPILWRKIAPGLSAGRVQSVAVRILVERERARMRFKTAQYWDLVATFATQGGGSFEATLVSLDGTRLAGGKDFDPDTGKLRRDDVHLLDEAGARSLLAAMKTATFSVVSAEEKPFSRTPSPPFTTSTLQQEGNRKLRFDAKRTMRAAQRLYENGYITYMRTDSVVLSATALDLTRGEIARTYGDEYLPDAPRTYKNTVANAQEAHEAIRPAGDTIAPVEEIARKLGADESKIYDLIWKRTIASQMKDAHGRRMTLKVGSAGTDQVAIFQAGGSVIDFPGFLRAYVEGADDPEQALADRETLLPPVSEGESVQPGDDLSAEEHRTSPPARLTEATLVKALEEGGIGRPSTYASIIDTIQRREYTFKKGSALVPSFTAFAVVSLMEVHLTHLIDPEFTRRMEDRLDAISRGEQERLAYLNEFYNGNGVMGLKPLLEDKAADIDPRTVCSIPLGQDEHGVPIIVRVGRYGPFLQRDEDTAPIPDQTCPDELTIEAATALLDAALKGDEPLGTHPEENQPIFLKTGRFGPYLQLGEPDPDDKKSKPQRASLLKGMTPEDVTIEVAVQLLSLPRTVGQDPDGVDIQAFNGRYGPYIKRGDDTRSLGPDDNLLTLTQERALALLAEERKGRGFRQQAKPIKVFAADEAPEQEGVEFKVLEGRYGPYVTDGTVNASLPKTIEDATTLTITHALELIER